MTVLSTLTLLFEYSLWADTRVLEACESLTPEQWDQSLGHSWGSVHGLLAHILAVEILWFARWQGESPTSLRSTEDFPTLADVRRAWLEVKAEMRDFIQYCDEARLQHNLSYMTTKGVPYSEPLWQLMLHLFNHGTHHRGELAAMLTLLGVPHPEDDLLFYLREK